MLGRRFICPIGPATQREFILDWRILDIFHLKGQLTKFVTSEAVKALGVFSCDIIDGPQRKYLKKSLNHFCFVFNSDSRQGS